MTPLRAFMLGMVNEFRGEWNSSKKGGRQFPLCSLCPLWLILDQLANEIEM